MVEKAPVVIGGVFGFLKVFFIRKWLFFKPRSKYSISLRKTQETHCKTAAFVIICKKTLKKRRRFFMKAFITGGTGNIGQYVTKAFLEAGHSVVLLTRTPRPHPCP